MTTDIWEGFDLEEVYGLLPNPCPNHEAVFVIQVYLTAQIQPHDLGKDLVINHIPLPGRNLPKYR